MKAEVGDLLVSTISGAPSIHLITKIDGEMVCYLSHGNVGWTFQREIRESHWDILLKAYKPKA